MDDIIQHLQHQITPPLLPSVCSSTVLNFSAVELEHWSDVTS